MDSIGCGRLKNGTKTGTMWEARDFSVSDIDRLRKLLHSETLNELLDRGYAYNVFSWRIIKLYKETWYAMLTKLGYPHDYNFHDVASRMIRDHERHYGIVPSIREINDAIEYPARRIEREIEREVEKEIKKTFKIKNKGLSVKYRQELMSGFRKPKNDEERRIVEDYKKSMEEDKKKRLREKRERGGYF